MGESEIPAEKYPAQKEKNHSERELFFDKIRHFQY